jgi:hypothetical protein
VRERTKAVAFVAAWVLSLGLVLAAVAAVQPARPPPAGPLGADLLIRGEGWTIWYRPAGTTNNTAFAILREANATLGFELRWVEYGWPYEDVFVTSINGTRNDGSRNLWWQYCVNESYASQGALHQEIRDGDTVVWVFAPPGGADLCR